MALTAQQVQTFYIGYYGRPADPVGSAFWQTQTEAQALAGFAGSAEFTNQFTDMTASQQVTKVYGNLLGRAPDTAGLLYWAGELTAGRETIGSLVLSMSKNALGKDVTTIADRVTYSTAFTTALNTVDEINAYAGATATQAARNALLKVISTSVGDHAALTTETAKIDATISAIVSGGTTSPGSIFTLTAGVDNILGTAASETMDASRVILSGQAFDAMGSADKIDGGDGTDTLFIQNVANATVTPNSIKNVEVIQIENSLAGTYGLSLANGDAAVKTVKVTNSTANVVTVNNIQSALTNLDLENLTAGVTVASVAAAIAGTTDALAISLSSVTGAAVITAAGYETLSITSNGTVANVLGQVIDASLTTLSISGSQNVTLTLDDATGGTNPTTALATVNASTATGRVNVTLDADSAQAVAFTGGTGNDTFNTNGTYGTTDVLNGGNGTDTLVLTVAQATGTTVVQSNVSNFEDLQVSALTGTLNANHFGATGLILGADINAGGTTVNFAAGTNKVDFRTFDDSAANVGFTVNVAGTATTDVLNVTAGNATAAIGAIGGVTWGNAGLTFNGAETVNLSSIGGANNFNGVFTITDTAANQSLVITGNQNAIFAGAVRADSINASGMTGTGALQLNGGTGTTASTITGTANADVLIGSTAGDIINGGVGADIIWNTVTGAAVTAADELAGGAGFDTFTLVGSSAQAAVTPLAAYAAASVITDFTVGDTATNTDFIRLSSANADYSAGLSVMGTANGAAGAVGVQALAQNSTAAAAVGMEVVKLTTGVAAAATLQATFNAAIGTGTVTAATDGVYAAIFFDTTNNKMVLVEVATGGNSIIETADVVRIIGTVDMTAANYGLIDTDNFAAFA